MADLSITAASVLKGAGASIINGTAGAALTAGQVAYKAADGAWELADSDVLATASAAGVVLHAAAEGQPVAIQTGGRITIGATVSVGQVYVLSTTAGGIAPYADLGTGDFLTIVGYGVSASQILLDIHATSIAKA